MSIIISISIIPLFLIIILIIWRLILLFVALIYSSTFSLLRALIFASTLLFLMITIVVWWLPIWLSVIVVRIIIRIILTTLLIPFINATCIIYIITWFPYYFLYYLVQGFQLFFISAMCLSLIDCNLVNSDCTTCLTNSDCIVPRIPGSCLGSFAIVLAISVLVSLVSLFLSQPSKYALPNSLLSVLVTVLMSYYVMLAHDIT